MDIRTRRSRPGPESLARCWKLAYLDAAEKDARRFLTDDHYAHAVQLFDELALEVNPRCSETQDVRGIEDFFELRDKGGILGKINLRVYFAVLDDHHIIVVLGVYKKEEEGQTPVFIKDRIRRRLTYVRASLSA